MSESLDFIILTYPWRLNLKPHCPFSVWSIYASKREQRIIVCYKKVPILPRPIKTHKQYHVIYLLNLIWTAPFSGAAYWSLTSSHRFPQSLASSFSPPQPVPIFVRDFLRRPWLVQHGWTSWGEISVPLSIQESADWWRVFYDWGDSFESWGLWPVKGNERLFVRVPLGMALLRGQGPDNVAIWETMDLLWAELTSLRKTVALSDSLSFIDLFPC